MPLKSADIYRDEARKIWRRRTDKQRKQVLVRGAPEPTDDVVWETEDKRYLLLTEMQTTHLRNCLAQMLLRANGWRKGYIAPIGEELKRRGSRCPECGVPLDEIPFDECSTHRKHDET